MRGKTCSLTAGQSGETEGKVLQECLKIARRYIQEQLNISMPQEMEHLILQGENTGWEEAGARMEIKLKIKRSDGRKSCILRISIEKKAQTGDDLPGFDITSRFHRFSAKTDSNQQHREVSIHGL